MPVDYNIALVGGSGIPLGGRAFANIETRDASALADVDSLTAAWYDQNGLLIETLTRTTIDVAGTDLYGNPSRIIDIAGTGTYKIDLEIEDVAYTPPAAGFEWTLNVSIIKGGVPKQREFKFRIIPTTLTISLDSSGISSAAMRQTGITKDVGYTANNATVNVSLNSHIVYAVNAAYKNGTAIVRPTDYTWTLYRGHVVLQAAPTAGDHYVFNVQTRSDDWVNDIVNRHVQEVLRAFKGHYVTSDDSFTQSPSVVEITKALVIGQMRQDMSEGVAMESAFYRTGETLQRQARMQILRIQRGEEEIYDTAGAVIVRKSGTLAGGHLSPNGLFAQRILYRESHPATGLYIGFAPYPWWIAPEVWGWP